MVQVTNLSRTREEGFRISGGKKGEPAKRVFLGPGETKDLDLIDRESPDVLGREVAGRIRINDKTGKEATAAPQPAKS